MYSSERAGMIRICDMMGPAHLSSVFVRELADRAHPGGDMDGYADTDPAGEARGLREALDALKDAGLPIPNVQARLRELDERVEKEPETVAPAPESIESYGGRPSEPETTEEATGDTEVGL